MSTFSVTQSKIQKLRDNNIVGPIDKFVAKTNMSYRDVQLSAQITNAQNSYRNQLGSYHAALRNAAIDYNEAYAQYSTKKALLSSDLSFLNQQLEALPTMLETKLSYSESLLANLQQTFNIQSKLLDTKYNELDRQKQINLGLLDVSSAQKTDDINRAFHKDSGTGLSRWAAGGFGSIGMGESIVREQQSYYARQQAYEDTKTSLQREALDVNYTLQKNLESDLLKSNYEADAMREQYNISTAQIESQSQTADIQNKIEQTQIQQKYLKAPTRRAAGPAPSDTVIATPY